MSKVKRPSLPLEPRERRFALWAAIGAAVVTAGATSYSIFAGLTGTTPWSFIDVVILLGLAFGVSRGSLSCAVGLVIFQVANRAYDYVKDGRPPDGLAYTLGALYLLGVIGVLARDTSPQTAVGGSGRNA